MNKKLLKLQKSLNKYFTYFKDENILVISEDKSSLPFLFVIVDPNYPTHLILSVAIDYPASTLVLDIAALCSKLGRIAVSHNFYISPYSGATHLDDDAYRQWDLDTIDLEKLESPSKELN